jgi:hypothetical protein
VVPWKIDLFYDLLFNQFARPGLPAGPRALNVNSIDEAPDSSWFTNRILARPVSVPEAVRGATTGAGPVPGPWTLIGAKTEGDAPGFTIRDSAGTTWFLAFDPKSNPEGATAAAVVASRIFWVLGYFQAEYYIAELRPDQLQVDPSHLHTAVWSRAKYDAQRRPAGVAKGGSQAERGVSCLGQPLAARQNPRRVQVLRHAV